MVELDYKTRNIEALIKRLTPLKIRHKDRYTFLWLVWDGMHCMVYEAVGSEYTIETGRVAVRDTLSGLFHKVPYARGRVDGKPVWESVWTGSRYTFRFINGKR